MKKKAETENKFLQALYELEALERKKFLDAKQHLDYAKNSSEDDETSFSKHAINQLERRSETITRLLDQFGIIFVSQLTTKEKLKVIFFCITLLLLIIVLVVCGILVFRLSREPLKGNLEGIAAFASAIGGGIAALLGIPKIVAEYLFNKEEDKSITSLLIEITKNDSSERHDLIEADQRQIIEEARIALSK